MDRWATVDTAAALRFAAQLTDPDVASLAAIRAAQAPRADLRVLSDALPTLPAAAHGEYLTLLFRAIEQRHGWPAAQTWASSHASPEAEAVLVTAWAERAPHSALAWLLQRHRADLPAEPAATLARALAREDGAAALEWIRAWPETAERTTTMRDVAATWARADAARTQAFLRAQPATEITLDPVRAALAVVLAERQPHAALTWSQSILDPATRERTHWDVLTRWWERDPVTLRQWLVATASPAQQAAVLDRLAPPCCGGSDGAP
jgi:hypothetical protein